MTKCDECEKEAKAIVEENEVGGAVYGFCAEHLLRFAEKLVLREKEKSHA